MLLVGECVDILARVRFVINQIHVRVVPAVRVFSASTHLDRVVLIRGGRYAGAGYLNHFAAQRCQNSVMPMERTITLTADPADTTVQLWLFVSSLFCTI